MLGKRKKIKRVSSNQNPFLQGKPNTSDVLLIAVAFLIGITFFVGSLQSQAVESAGSIYLNLTFIIFILAVLAIASSFNMTAWVIYGSAKQVLGFSNPKQSILVMIIVGILITLFLQAKPFGLSIGIPLSISSTGTVLGDWYQYSIVSFYGPLMEELFWIGLLLPSFLKYARNSSQMGELVFITFGIFLVLLGVEYTGITGIILGIVLFGMAGLMTLKRIYTPLNRLPLGSPLLAIPVAAFALVILHAYSYGNFLQNLPLFGFAELFFIIEGLVDYYFGSIVPSIMMHTVNNAYIAQTILGVTGITIGSFIIQPWMMMTLLMAIFLMSIFRVRFMIIPGQIFSPYRFEDRIARNEIIESPVS